MQQNKWVMVSYSEFIKSAPPYFVTLAPSLGSWIWTISDDKNNVIDSAIFHNNAPTSELDGKAKADRILAKLLNT